MNWHQKAIKDLKQAMFINSMHFQKNVRQQIEISLDLVDVMIKGNEINEAFTTIESVNDLAMQQDFYDSDIKLKCRILQLLGFLQSKKECLEEAIKNYKECDAVSE